MQFFANGPNAISIATGGNTRYISAFFGAGGSAIWNPDSSGVLGELTVGYWQISLPQYLVIPPNYNIVLSIDGNETGDVLSNLAIGLDDVLEFR